MRNQIRILIADDHYLVRIGLQTSLNTDPSLNVIAEASSGSQAIDLYRKYLPDIVLMDLRMPNFGGIEATATLHKEFPLAKVIVISSYDGEEDIYRSFQAGARGYLLKNGLNEELFTAIKAVHNGELFIPPDIARCLSEHDVNSDLTPKEHEVLELLIKGLSNKEIGRLMRFSTNTAKFHVKNILSKLDVNDRTEAATAAFQRGIFH